MRSLIPLILILIITVNAFSQEPYQLQFIHNGTNTTTNYDQSHITSDYGPRWLQDSPWHKGIDLQRPGQNVGDVILSPCHGVVKQIKGNGYKWIKIQGTNNSRHFTYAHLFENDDPEINKPIVIGNMALILIEANKWVILNLNTGIALGENNSGTVHYNGNDYPIQNTVEPGTALGIIGNSGGNYPVHLHLYALRNYALDPQGVFNNYDPMAVINFGERSKFKCRVQNVGINYGTNSKSYFKTRAQMIDAEYTSTYPDHMYDVNLVELFIKPAYKQSEPQVSNWGTTNSSYQYYRGEHTKSYINQGGRPQESSSSMYPISPSDHNIKSSDNGNAQKTGVEPFAYRDHVGRPYDFFCFS